MFSNPGSMIWMWILIGNAAAVFAMLNVGSGSTRRDM